MRLRDRDLLRRMDRLLRPEANAGLELCKLGLMDALWNSTVERRVWSLHYRQEGCLRLIAETAHGNLHGEFLLFYPDGKIWMKGAYRNNGLVKRSMKVFTPDGSLLKPVPLPDNVIRFPRRESRG